MNLRKQVKKILASKDSDKEKTDALVTLVKACVAETLQDYDPATGTNFRSGDNPTEPYTSIDTTKQEEP